MNQTIGVNITPQSFQPTLHYSQGDVGRVFVVNVTDYDIPSGATVTCVATKPSGMGFTVSGTVSGNTVTFTSTAEMTDEWGRFPAEIRIASGSTLLGTANFLMIGEKDPHPASTIDGTQEELIPQLTLLVNRVEAAAESVHDLTVSATTLAAGSDATATYDSTNNSIAFGIPRGADGDVTRSEFNDLKSELSYIQDNNLGYEASLILNCYSDTFSQNTIPNNSPFILDGYYQLNTRVIGAIKLKITTTGTLSIGYIAKDSSFSGAYDSSLVTVVDVLRFTSTGEQTKRCKPFIVPSGCSLFVCLSTDTAKWTYGGASAVEAGGFHYVSSGNYASTSSAVGIDFYEVIGIDGKGMSDYLDSIKPEMGVIKNNYTPNLFCDGYASTNSVNVQFNVSPFVAVSNNSIDEWVTAIKAKFVTAGVLTIGTVKKDKVWRDATYNANDLDIKCTLTIPKTGVQTIFLDKAIYVGADEYVFIGQTTDTAFFVYGDTGTDKGFYHIDLDGTKYSASSRSLGVTIYGLIAKDAIEISSYYEKTLSILGDSISTFSGYIPSGNATYYPSGTVQDVSDTWWYKLYTALGMTLNVNNSWSGSRVTTTAGETSAGCMTRCQSLGTNPDVIIVWMGINDFNNEVALGTYDGTTALPSVTTTFREAYAIMLNKILTAYQSSEVWVCTLPQCERNAESGFPEINGNGVALAEFNKAILELANAFGVKVLDHNKCGLTYQNMPTYNPDNLHPNKYGHSLVANNDIRQMDNVVRTRY